jgi:hypothetical protein
MLFHGQQTRNGLRFCRSPAREKDDAVRADYAEAGDMILDAHLTMPGRIAQVFCGDFDPFGDFESAFWPG